MVDTVCAYREVWMRPQPAAGCIRHDGHGIVWTLVAKSAKGDRAIEGEQCSPLSWERSMAAGCSVE